MRRDGLRLTATTTGLEGMKDVVVAGGAGGWRWNGAGAGAGAATATAAAAVVSGTGVSGGRSASAATSGSGSGSGSMGKAKASGEARGGGSASGHAGAEQTTGPGWRSAGFQRDALLAGLGLAGALGVASGAFGFHGLGRMLRARGEGEERVRQLSRIWNTGVNYSLVHCAAGVGLLAPAGVAGAGTGFGGGGGLAGHAAGDTPLPHRWTAGLFLLGTQLFGTGLTLFVATQARPFQMLAPIGGTALVGGWLHLAYDAASRALA